MPVEADAVIDIPKIAPPNLVSICRAIPCSKCVPCRIFSRLLESLNVQICPWIPTLVNAVIAELQRSSSNIGKEFSVSRNANCQER